MARFIVCIAIVLVGIVASGCAREAAQSTEVDSSSVGNHSASVFSLPATPTQSRSDDRPDRLLVPSVHIDAQVVPVGILSNGEMGIPGQDPWIDAGWFKGGPRPGERGSAVIDGHLDRPGGSPAVFWSLRNLHVGNLVMIVTASGKALRFHVTRIAYYTPQEAPLQAIFGDTGGEYLNLITCAGDWIPDQHQTTLRLVVYTSSG